MSQLAVLVFKVLYFLFFTGEKVEVRAAPLAPQAELAALSVHVEADGSARFEGEKLTLEALEKKLAARLAQEKDLALIIKADAEIAFDKVVRVVDACQKAGVHNVGFGTKPAAGEAEPIQPQFEEEAD